MDPEQVRVAVDGLRAAELELKRRTPIEVSVTPPAHMAVDRDLLEAYASAGVSRLVLLPPTYDDPERLMTFVGEPP